MLAFDPTETVRSVQLYGVDPHYVGEAVRILAGEHAVAHVDLNFGCPVPKVTRRGGGAALPFKRGLLDRILRAAVTAAAPYGIPVTMKTRKGIDEQTSPTLTPAGSRRMPAARRLRYTDARRRSTTPAPRTGGRSPA